jgi:hypothetical protein
MASVPPSPHLEVPNRNFANPQVRPPSAGKEYWVTSNTGPTKGHSLEAFTASRKNHFVSEAGSQAAQHCHQ